MLAQGVLLGIASALLFHPSLAVIPQWFSTKRALAIGIAVAGSALGNSEGDIDKTCLVILLMVVNTCNA